MRVQLNVWIEGYEEPVGRLTSDESGRMEFHYFEDFVHRADAVPLSLALPFAEQDQIFPDVVARAYFENLLEENESRRRQLLGLNIDPTDVAGTLMHFGADCAGAVSCLPLDAPPIKRPGLSRQDYDEMPIEDLKAITNALAKDGRLPNDSRDASPVAGVQPKLAVALFNGSAGELGFFLPKPGSGAPTTHIIKVPKRPKEAQLEHIATRLAAQLGISCINTFWIETELGAPCIISERFDRVVAGDGAGGFEVRRLHQEDFCQALGMSRLLKYERNGGGERRYSVNAIRRILDQTATPAVAKGEFLRLTLFNLLIGNSDNHAKNHALLYKGGVSPILAPAYDLLPSRTDRTVNDALAFTIGAASHPEDVRRDDLKQFASRLYGVRRDLGKDQLTALNDMIRTIEKGRPEMTRMGLKPWPDICGAMLTHIASVIGEPIIVAPYDDFDGRTQGGWGHIS
jgi:serine/threonine-protein kinase HipA